MTQDYPPAVGGIQRYAHALGLELCSRLNSVVVLAPDQPGAAEFDATVPHPVVRMETSSDWMRLRVLPTLLRVIEAHGVNTIVTGHWYVAAAALWARRMGRVDRVYLAAHGQELLKDPVPGPLRAAYRAHRASVVRRVDGCFPVSRYTGKLLADLGVAPERIHIVPNGTDPERFDNETTREAATTLRARYDLGEGPILSTVARLVPRKGIDTVIEALPDLCAAHDGLMYCVAGGGPDQGRLEALAQRLGVANRVRFLGRIPDDDVGALYQVCSAFVMPARQEGASVEGFGLVFREAGACGAPVVGSYSGGIPDAIQNGDTGLLVPPGDSDELANAVSRILNSPGLASQMGARGREVARSVGTWQHAADRMAAVLEACA
ncbi:MAG: phosphatidylinositol alpha-1,6-mannosyltransferase [Myxococcota bacterium]|jgi:phosphatidylinositol alpha-1,6-mannosyltransferase